MRRGLYTHAAGQAPGRAYPADHAAAHHTLPLPASFYCLACFSLSKLSTSYNTTLGVLIPRTVRSESCQTDLSADSATQKCCIKSAFYDVLCFKMYIIITEVFIYAGDFKYYLCIKWSQKGIATTN